MKPVETSYCKRCDLEIQRTGDGEYPWETIHEKAYDTPSIRLGEPDGFDGWFFCSLTSVGEEHNTWHGQHIPEDPFVTMVRKVADETS